MIYGDKNAFTDSEHYKIGKKCRELLGEIHEIHDFLIKKEKQLEEIKQEILNVIFRMMEKK